MSMASTPQIEDDAALTIDQDERTNATAVLRAPLIAPHNAAYGAL